MTDTANVSRELLQRTSDYLIGGGVAAGQLYGELKAALAAPQALTPYGIQECHDLTCMVYGAPWPDDYLQGLVAVLALYDSLRASGEMPVDPASAPVPSDTTGSETELQEQVGSVQWAVVHQAVSAAIEKCKEATGQHRHIDLVVNATQITHDALGTEIGGLV